MPTDPAPVTLNYSAAFLKQLKRLSKKYRHIRADLQPILDELQAGQTPGEQIQRTGSAVYKVRVANSDAQRGTRGGYRVIYYVHTPSSRLLLAIYSKTEQSDIPAQDIQRILQEELAR